MTIKTLCAGALLALGAAHAAAADNPCNNAGTCQDFDLKNPVTHQWDNVYRCRSLYQFPVNGGNVGALPRVLFVNKLDPADSPQILPSFPAGTAGTYQASNQKCGGVYYWVPTPGGKRGAGNWGTNMIPNPNLYDPVTHQQYPGVPMMVPPPCGYYYSLGDCPSY